MKKYDIYKMRNMRLSGNTLQQIGEHYSLTRERVRQVLAENFGEQLSSARNLTEYVRNEIMDYQWDSATNEKDALVIAKRIIASFRPMQVDNSDPLAILIK